MRIWGLLGPPYFGKTTISDQLRRPWRTMRYKSAKRPCRPRVVALYTHENQLISSCIEKDTKTQQNLAAACFRTLGLQEVASGNPCLDGALFLKMRIKDWKSSAQMAAALRLNHVEYNSCHHIGQRRMVKGNKSIRL